MDQATHGSEDDRWQLNHQQIRVTRLIGTDSVYSSYTHKKMSSTPNQRRLAAILAADVAGYTRLIEQDTDRHGRRLESGAG